MDGYAMPADDAAGPWSIVGESAAGHPFTGKLATGQAVRISTGALMPVGAGLVLLQENATREGDQLRLNGEGEPSARHIRRTGFDFATGQVVLQAGTLVRPPQLAVALSAGHAALPVHRLPSVAVIDSGDELSADPANCLPHQIPASNGAMIEAMVRPYAAQVQRIGPVADSAAALALALEQAAGCDVLVTSGGASVGDHDLVRPALEAWGAEISFWRVAIKPGKPLMVARRDDQWIIGLPGNPVSSYVTAFLFLLPLLRRLGGAATADALPRALAARLTAPVPPTEAREEFLRGQFDFDRIVPLGQQDSSALATLALANALIHRPAHSPEIAAGNMVSVYLLENGGIA
jgi:molybdopterin molybdotransferase